jgi:hypothetical protein
MILEKEGFSNFSTSNQLARLAIPYTEILKYQNNAPDEFIA